MMVLSRDDETIVAQCTPTGSGAIALLRLSGSTVVSIVEQCSQLASKKKISEVESHTVHLGTLYDAQGQPLDQVMFIVMHGPKTFTGQDIIEITCHNNPFLIQSIIERLIFCGARMAFEGEFSKRAFMNGKIDLLQAESINDLIHANTQLALKKSLAGLQGSFSHWIGQIENELIRALAWCEASFEFLDEEAEFAQRIKEHLQNLTAQIETIKKTFNNQQQIRQGIKIALLGSVNAGKSSLFNALLDQSRSIVTPIAGTTRDVVEAGLHRNGNFWTLLDTAGLRHADDFIEQEGIKRSYAEAQKADIILLIFDGSRLLSSDECAVYETILSDYAHKTIVIANKSDLGVIHNHPLACKTDMYVSTVEQEKMIDLETKIEEKIKQLFTVIESPFLLNQRHYTLLVSIETKLAQIIGMLCQAVSYELVSIHLKDVLQTLSELTGRSVSESGLNQVFKEFCVGK